MYAIHVRDMWVYSGASGNIEVILLQHFNGDQLSIRHHQPAHSAFELVPAKTRRARQRELIAEFEPLCD